MQRWSRGGAMAGRAALALVAAVTGCAGLDEDPGDPLEQEIAGPAPDYIVSALDGVPSTAVNGVPFPVVTTVQNAGDAAAVASSTTRFFLSADPVIGGDNSFAQSAVVPPLGIGASDTQTTYLVIAGGVPAGSYFIIACADRRKTVPETNDKNNCTASDEEVAIAAPDLAVEAISEPPPTLVVGSKFAISDTTRNVGTAAAPSSPVGYFLSPTPSRGPGEKRLASSRQTGPLAPGAATSGGVTARVPVLPAGSYYLVACADVSNSVAESNDTNNCTASVGTAGIGPADLAIASLGDPPASLLAGDSFEVADVVVNQGHLPAQASNTGFVLSPDELPGADVAVDGSRSVPALLAGQTSGGTTVITVDVSTPPGDYFLLACADATGLVAEQFETNNCRASAARVTVRPLDTSCGPDTGGIVIASVTTADGATQIRQGAQAQLVITGSGLETATEVTVSGIATSLVSVSPTELRADIWIEHATAPGPRALTVRGPAADCSLEAAIELTPFVVSPTGSLQGLGTFESPLALCAPSLDGDSGSGDTVLLLAGEHVCEAVVLDDVIVAGEGVGTTTILGSVTLAGSASALVTVRDLTIVAPVWAVQLRLDGTLAARGSIENLVAQGGGIDVSTATGASGGVTVTNYSFSGPGIGLRNDASPMTVSEADFSSCGTGIAIANHRDSVFGSMTLSDATITSCGTGVLSEDGMIFATRLTISDSDVAIDLAETLETPREWPFNYVQLTDSQLVDSTIGVRIAGGGLTTFTTEIIGDPSTPRPSLWGIHVTNGAAEMHGGRIAGQERAGIEIDSTVGHVNEEYPQLRLYGLQIVGGERGVFGHGPAYWSYVEMSSSVIRDQTIAAVTWAINPGENSLAGDNRLSVLSGFALEDLRSEFFPPFPNIDATGIRLNGRAYTGLIQGPASVAPDYRIQAEGGAIQF